MSAFLFNATLFNFEWIEKNAISSTLQIERELRLVLATLTSKIWGIRKFERKNMENSKLTRWL